MQAFKDLSSQCSPVKLVKVRPAGELAPDTVAHRYGWQYSGIARCVALFRTAERSASLVNGPRARTLAKMGLEVPQLSPGSRPVVSQQYFLLVHFHTLFPIGQARVMSEEHLPWEWRARKDGSKYARVYRARSEAINRKFPQPWQVQTCDRRRSGQWFPWVSGAI